MLDANTAVVDNWISVVALLAFGGGSSFLDLYAMRGS